MKRGFSTNVAPWKESSHSELDQSNRQDWSPPTHRRYEIQKSGVGVEFEMAGGVSIQIVLPSEKVFGVGVEVEGVGGAVILALSLVLEFHGKPRLAGAVVGVEKQDSCWFINDFAAGNVAS